MTTLRTRNRNIIIAIMAICLVAFVAFGYLFLKNFSESRNGSASAPKFDGLEFESKLKTKYATQFSIYKYKGGYSYIDLVDSDKILVFLRVEKCRKI